MRRKTIVFLRSIIMLLGLMVPAFTHAEKPLISKGASADWNISDYYNHLPPQYITFFGDFSSDKDKLYKLTDIQHGYLGLREFKEGQLIIFEMALFRSPPHGTLLVIMNYQYDFVCAKYDNYFLIRQGDKWLDVSADVLPELNPDMFYRNVSWPQELLDNFSFSYLPKLPRQGMEINITLEVCDHVEGDSPLKYKEVEAITNPDVSVRLTWDRNQGRFIFLPPQKQ